MSAQEKTMPKSELDSLKSSYDYFASAVQVLSTRVQFYAEEFQGVANTINFLSTLRDQVKTKIEEIEPPVKAEKAQALDMDLTHLKVEEKSNVVEFNS